MKVVALFICCAFLAACGSDAPPQRLPGPLQKVSIVNAVDNQAVCLDGSPAAYYFQNGMGKGVESWVIHFEGGGRCGTLAECASVSPQFSSSNSWEDTLLGKGILSDIFSENPYFYESNHVLLRQCSADGWIGTKTSQSGGSNGYNFAGSIIFKRIIQDLISTKSLDQAKSILLTGASSGTQGVFQHLDWLSTRLPQVTVKGVVDAGFAIEKPAYQGNVLSITSQMKQYKILHKSYIEPDCAAANASSTYRCLLPEVVMPHITSPIMIKDSQYDNVVLSKYGVFTPYDVQEQAYVDQYVIALKASLSVQPYVFSDRSFRHTLLATKGFVSREVGQVFFSDFLAQWFYQGQYAGSIIE